MGSGRGWLAGDWPSTGGVLNITAVVLTGGVLATKSERNMLASTCLYSLYVWFGTSVIRWYPQKFYGDDHPKGNPSVGGLNTREVAKYSDFKPMEGYISETVQDRR